MAQISTLMTRREEEGPHKEALVATTKGDEPNVKIITLPWYAMVGIRVIRVYLQSVVGILGIGTFSDLVPGDDLNQKIIHSLIISLGISFVTLIQNAVEILTKLDTSNPTLRG